MSKKAIIYEIELPDQNKSTINEKNILVCINNITKNNKFYKRGDIIRVLKLSGYRNEYTYIYNGIKFQKLGTLNDEYGEVPKTFLTFTEFPPFYWEDSITHNDHHYINPSILKMKKSVFLYKGLKLYIYTIRYNSKNYKIASVNSIDNKKLVLIRPFIEDKYFDFVVKPKTMKKLELEILDF